MGLLSAYDDPNYVGSQMFDPNEGTSTEPGPPGGGPVPTTPGPWLGGYIPNPTTVPAAAPPTTTPVHGGGGGGVGTGGQFPGYNFGAVPAFNAPAFVRPDAKSILSAPGFQARLQSGEDALQRSAASKGLLRSGGTLKDLIEYGQNFASNEYNNEFNQALQTYGANYQRSKDMFAPLLAQWDLLSKADVQRALAQYNRGTIWNNPHGGGGGVSYPEGLLGPGQFGL